VNQGVALAAPQPGRRARLVTGLAALLLVASAPVAWNALTDNSAADNSLVEYTRGTGANGASSNAARRVDSATARPPSVRTPSALNQAAPAALLQTPALASVIDDLIGEALGNASLGDDPHGFRARLASIVRRQFAPMLADDAMAFVLRYVSYLESLDAMHLRPSANDIETLRATFEARRSLRMALFSSDEYAALFAADDRLDRYTMARFEIGADGLRPSAERAAALSVAERELTADERDERGRWLEHLSMLGQTAAFDAQGVNEQARFEVRAATHGEAVAQRLAENDRAERDWAARLAQYELALKSYGHGTTGDEDLAATRNRLFSGREQLRLDAALSLRRQQRKT